MQKFAVNDCLSTGYLRRDAEQWANMDATPIKESVRATLIANLANVEKLCADLSLAQSRLRSFDLQDKLIADEHLKQLTYPAVGSLLSALLDLIASEASFRIYLSLPEELAKYYDKEKLLGDAVFNAFPSARNDIREAGNCLACDFGTAAVFHLMRAVEWGIRALSVNLGVLDLPRKAATIPIEYGEWDKILDQLQPAANRKIDAISIGPEKQKAQEFYQPILLDIRGFKDAFRNHVMHTRKDYSPKLASDVLDHIERFMQRLAERVTEA